MNSIRRSKTFFFALLIAFLAAQWSTAHIHLATNHVHDGSHHQHASQGHLHGPGSHHADAIDVSHTTTHDSVVSLDHECTSTSHAKPDHQADIFVLVQYCPQHESSERLIGSVVSGDSGSTWLSYTHVRSRAPPRFTS